MGPFVGAHAGRARDYYENPHYRTSTTGRTGLEYVLYHLPAPAIAPMP